MRTVALCHIKVLRQVRKNAKTHVLLDALQGSSLSSVTGALQNMDPLHTAYLDWHLLVRNFIAQAVPSLSSATSEQLLQLKQRLQQADSNADGLLTEPELMSIDMGAFLSSKLAVEEVEVEADENMTSNSAGNAVDGSAAAAAVSNSAEKDEQSLEQEDLAGDVGGNQTSSAEMNGQQTAGQLNQLLFRMFGNNEVANAAASIEDILLYLCSNSDGASGLSKAFAVVSDNVADGQVVIKLNLIDNAVTAQLACCHMHELYYMQLGVVGSHLAILLCRRMRRSSTGCLQPPMLRV
jgi:hypothetical protein